MKVSSVEMNQIEFVNVLDDVIYQKDFSRNGVFAALILPERPLAGRHKSRFRNGVAAGKQSDVVSGANQFLRKIRDDPFRSSVVFWRHTFDKRRNLSNSHVFFSLCEIQASLTHCSSCNTSHSESPHWRRNSQISNPTLRM